MKISDYRGNQIELTSERWEHIITEHPEVRRFKHRLLYYRYYPDIFGGKYLLAVVKIHKRPLLLTYYVTDRIKEGDVIWQRS